MLRMKGLRAQLLRFRGEEVLVAAPVSASIDGALSARLAAEVDTRLDVLETRLDNVVTTSLTPALEATIVKELSCS